MSGPVLVNGQPALAFCLTLPVVGAWHCDFEIDAESLPTSAVAIDDSEGNRFIGSAARSGSYIGRLAARAAAGSGGIGGLTKTLKAKHFRTVTVRSVVSEVLAQAKDSLAPSAQQATLQRQLAFWSIGDDAPRAALRELTQAVGATWRMLDSGKLWLGVETYPPAAEFEFAELPRDDAIGVATLAVDAFTLRPGTTFQGRRVERVEHRLDEQGHRRTTYWY